MGLPTLICTCGDFFFAPGRFAPNPTVFSFLEDQSQPLFMGEDFWLVNGKRRKVSQLPIVFTNIFSFPPTGVLLDLDDFESAQHGCVRGPR
jgi:hypothetical protein